MSIARAVKSWWRASRSAKHITHAEYWVYLAAEELPSQEAMLKSMIAKGLGPSEGVLFSDIRLTIGLVLRSKNPHTFRPDLLATHLDVNREELSGLAASSAIARVRFISEEATDDRHLSFLPMLAISMAELSNSKLIYDVMAERLWSTDAFREASHQPGSAFHLNVFWNPTPAGGTAETGGLRKIGLPELKSLECEADRRVLACEVMAQASEALWGERAEPETMLVTCFDDQFKLSLTPVKGGPTQVGIVRVESSE